MHSRVKVMLPCCCWCFGTLSISCDLNLLICSTRVLDSDTSADSAECLLTILVPYCCCCCCRCLSTWRATCGPTLTL
jgi:hypothetical protein